MSNKFTSEELMEIALQLSILKSKNPSKFYEYKGRINALYENEIEKEDKHNIKVSWNMTIFRKEKLWKKIIMHYY